MPGEHIKAGTFLLEEDIKASTHSAERCEELGTYEIRKREMSIRMPYRERSSLREPCDMFSRDIPIAEKSSAIRIALKSLCQKRIIENRLADAEAKSLDNLSEEGEPCIIATCAVIAMRHSDKPAIRCRYDIKGGVSL